MYVSWEIEKVALKKKKKTLKLIYKHSKFTSIQSCRNSPWGRGSGHLGETYKRVTCNLNLGEKWVFHPASLHPVPLAPVTGPCLDRKMHHLRMDASGSLALCPLRPAWAPQGTATRVCQWVPTRLLTAQPAPWTTLRWWTE